jgi:hypothetical protein
MRPPMKMPVKMLMGMLVKVLTAKSMGTSTPTKIQIPMSSRCLHQPPPWLQQMQPLKMMMRSEFLTPLAHPSPNHAQGRSKGK